MSNGLEQSERRQWPRFHLTSIARLRVNRNGIEHYLSGSCHELSMGGALLIVNHELRIGEEMQLRIELPYSSPVYLTGIIRTRHNHEYGIEFTALSEEARDRLNRNCTSLALLD